MDSSSIQKIKDILDSNDKAAIAVGKNPTIDEMGAALALYLSLQDSGKSVSIASPSEPIVELSSLVGIDKVKTGFEGTSGDLVVSFPYKEREIEKVSYTLEDGFLNIIVKAGEDGLSFDEKDITYKRKSGTPTLLFVVGTPRIADLGSLFDTEALKNTTIINIDNKADNQGFGDVAFVSPRFSSVSEQITQLITSLGLPLDVDIAQNLLSGLSFATQNFQDPKTSYVAFETAAELIKKGASRQKAPAVQATNSFAQESPFYEPQMPSQIPSMPNWNQVQAPRDQQREESRFKQIRPQGVSQAQPTQRQPQPFPRPQMTTQPLQVPDTRPLNQSRPSFPQQPRTQQPQQAQNPMANRPTQPKAQPQQEDKQNQPDAPSDWLTPKVYKGSSLI